MRGGFAAALCGKRRCRARRVRGEPEPSPVDAQVVAGAVQGSLFDVSGINGMDRTEQGRFTDRIALFLCVQTELVVGSDGDGNIVRLSVVGGRRDFKIRDGTRAESKVVQQQRRGETERKRDLRAGVCIIRREIVHVEAGLPHGFAAAAAHKAIDFAVNCGKTAEAVLRTRPVARVVGNEGIRHAPDGKVGVDGDQGNGGRSHLHSGISILTVVRAAARAARYKTV